MKSHHPGCMSDEECQCQDRENKAEIESDTPETDAAEWYDAMCDPDRVVPSDFARRLERERDEARRLAEKYRNRSCDSEEECDNNKLPWEKI